MLENLIIRQETPADYKSAELITFNAVTIVCIPLAFVLMIANLKFANFLMHWFNKR